MANGKAAEVMFVTFRSGPLRLCDLYSLSPHLLSHMEDRRDNDSSEDPEKMGKAQDGRHWVPE